MTGGAASIRAAAEAALDAILVARLQAQQNLAFLGKVVVEDHYVEPVAAFYRTGGDPRRPKPAKPATTTIDALQAAQWTRICEGTWEIVWADYTQYADAIPEDDDAEWMCQLSIANGRWIYDFDHDFRGGPQLGNGLDVHAGAFVEEAQAACKKGLEHWIQRWTDAADEQRWKAERESEDDA